jgi:hypothetical protein
LQLLRQPASPKGEMPIVTKPIRAEAFYKVKILAVGRREKRKLNCPTIEFLLQLKKERPDELSRLTAVLEQTATNGPLKNSEKFKKIEGSEGLFEFKSYQLRLFCFFDEGSIIICANGVIKKQDKHKSQDVETAINWKQSYFQAKQNNQLINEKEQPEKE